MTNFTNEGPNNEAVQKFMAEVMKKALEPFQGIPMGDAQDPMEEALRSILGAFIGEDTEDENMDVESTHLEDVSKHFTGNPINDIVQLNMELATGAATISEVQDKLLDKVVEYQDFLAMKAKEEEEIEEEAQEEEVKAEKTLAEFVAEVISDLPIESPEYAQAFGKQLMMAIERLQHRAGRVEFYVQTTSYDEDDKMGTITSGVGPDGESVRVQIAGGTYTFPEEKAYTTVSPEGFSGTHDAEEEEEDESCNCYCGCDCDCGEGDSTCEGDTCGTAGEEYVKHMEILADEEVEKQREESIKALEAESMATLQSAEPNPEDAAVLDALELRLNSIKEFSPTDLELIRYWLRRQPFSSDLEIDTLTEEQVALAWRQTQFIKNMR